MGSDCISSSSLLIFLFFIANKVGTDQAASPRAFWSGPTLFVQTSVSEALGPFWMYIVHNFILVNLLNSHCLDIICHQFYYE